MNDEKSVKKESGGSKNLRRDCKAPLGVESEVLIPSLFSGALYKWCLILALRPKDSFSLLR